MGDRPSSASPFALSPPDPTLGPGAIAGIVLGSLLGLALLAALLLLCVCCLRRFRGECKARGKGPQVKPHGRPGRTNQHGYRSLSANQMQAPPLSPQLPFPSAGSGCWDSQSHASLFFFVCVFFLPLSFPGEIPKKRKHLPTFAPVIPPPERKMQSMVPVQTPQPLPPKVPLEAPSPPVGSVPGQFQVSVQFLCYLVRETKWSEVSSRRFTRLQGYNPGKMLSFKKIHKGCPGLPTQPLCQACQTRRLTRAK